MSHRLLLGLLAVALLGIVGYAVWDKNHRQEPAPAEELSIPAPKIDIQTPHFELHLKPKTAYDYQEGLRLAREAEAAGKPVHVLVVVGADWCQPCKKFERETLSSPEVKAYLEKNNYIVIHVNAEKEPTLAAKYQVSHFPTYFIITTGEQQGKTDSGFKNARQFKRWLEGPTVERRGLFARRRVVAP